MNILSNVLLRGEISNRLTPPDTISKEQNQSLDING